MAILAAGFFIFLAHLFAGLFDRIKLPDVLLLIAIGLVIGPLMGWVKPEQFGQVGPVFTTVTLVIMLFEGGIDLDLKVMGNAARETMLLTASSFLVTAAASGLLVRFLTGMPWLLALMLGAAVGSTSPAVIVPLVKRIGMSEHGRTILFLESAISDVLSIVVALALLGAYQLGHIQVGEVLGRIVASFLLAALIGAGSGLLWSFLLKEIRAIPNTNFTTLAFVFIVFGIPELLGYSGFIAALAFGITLGNIKTFDLRPLKRIINKDLITFNAKEKNFFAEIVFLLKTFFFLYVGISMQVTNWWAMMVGAAVVALVFLLRIPVVRVSVPAAVPRADAACMAVMIPKGLAAVVLASVPLQLRFPEGQLMQNITYNIVLLSIVATSLLVFLQGRTALASFYQHLAGKGGETGKEVGGSEKDDKVEVRK